MKTRLFYKFVSFLLIGIFPMSLNGVVINSHLCQGQLVSLGIFAEAQECENCPENQCRTTIKGSFCEMQKSNCCMNGHNYFKVTVDTEELPIQEQTELSLINPFTTVLTFGDVVDLSAYLTMRHRPPEIFNVNAYLLFGQFLI